MSLVKEYKGVKIFVNYKGEFYCDAKNNSNDYNKKTFNSHKLQNIEKAIDTYEGEIENGEQFYYVNLYSHTITLLKVVRKIGDRLFFDNERDSLSYGIGNLRPKSFDETEEYSKLVSLFERLIENKKQQTELYNEARALLTNI